MADKVNQYQITCWPELHLNYWAIPKSGSTSVLASLIALTGRGKINDMSFDDMHGIKVCKYISRLEATTNGYWNISLVRDPYTRTMSLFKDFGLRRNHKRMIRDKSIDRSMLWNLDYFIDKQITPSIDDRDNGHVRSQSWYLTDSDGTLLVDYVYKLEQIQELYDFLGITGYTLNTTPESFRFTREQKMRIYQRYRNDFRLFRYKQGFDWFEKTEYYEIFDYPYE